MFDYVALREVGGKKMHSKILPLLAFAVLIGGCAPPDELQAGMERYKDEPVNELVARLGPANSISPGPEGPVWIWATGESLTGSSLSCALRVRVDDAQRIRAADWAGNYGACRNLSQRLQAQRY